MIVEDCQIIQLDFYTEGPVMDGDGNIFCTTLTGGNILKISKNGNPSIWAQSACPNGQVILANGDHLVCDSALPSIGRYNRDGVFLGHVMHETCGGVKVNVPNDLIVDKSGGLYFTDSVRNDGKVFHLSAGGSEKVVATGLDYPNGLALSADEKILFVAESYQNRIIAIDLASPGVTAACTRIVADLPSHHSGKAEANLPDGIAVDSNSQIWVAHYGMGAIQVITVDGFLIHSLEIPFPLVSNVFLRDGDHSKVVVTGGYGEPGPGAMGILRVK